MHAKWTALLVFNSNNNNNNNNLVEKEMRGRDGTSAWKWSTPINIKISLSDLSLLHTSCMSLSISESDRMNNFCSTLDGKHTESVNLFYLHLQSLESTSIINWIDLSLALSMLRMLPQHAMLHFFISRGKLDGKIYWNPKGRFFSDVSW